MSIDIFNALSLYSVVNQLSGYVCDSLKDKRKLTRVDREVCERGLNVDLRPQKTAADVTSFFFLVPVQCVDLVECKGQKQTLVCTVFCVCMY